MSVLIFIGFIFVVSSAHAQPSSSRGYILHIQMTPAVCALDPNRKKQRKCLEGYALTVAGLVPEGRYTECETSSSAILPPLQARVVARIIPDEASRIQLWQSVGGCMSMSAVQYFRTIINYAQRLKIPAALTDSASHNIQKKALLTEFLRLNSGMSSDGVEFYCQKNHGTTLLTHVSVCYNSNGTYKACSSHEISNCPKKFTIQGTY
ncbi:ribonuclease I [Acinetobacter sp. MB5]|uniref:ribonuclease T2 family protein n=1 Tax=Acinetobacter sp. MB5 TaxID=2069438 RepID=UPI00148C2D52|nr:ribonuclease I [Acinetobacter sp. MB5]